MSGDLESPKVTEWRRRMERFGRSDLTVVAFCGEEGVSAPSFYQWRRRLAEERGVGSGESGGFATVRVVGSASVSALLPGGTRVEIPTADEQALRATLEALARVDAERAGGSPC